MANGRQSNQLVTLQDQLYSTLAADIADGTYGPGDKLPSESEFMERFHVSRVTVRKVLDRFVKEGTLFKKQGKGTFVASKPYQDNLFSSGSFSENCRMMGAEPSTEIVSVRRKAAPSDVANILGGQLVTNKAVVLTRLRLVDGVPCIVEEDYFPDGFDYLFDTDLTGQSVLKLVRDQRGLEPSIFTDRFLVAHANSAHAKLLDCPVRHPLIKVVQTVSTASDNPIYVNYQYVMPERYVYVVRQKYTWTVGEHTQG